MRHVLLPHTDLQVSCLSLGSVPFGTFLTAEDSFKLLDSYVAAGGTFLDTAHIYADWLSSERQMSEKTLGRWLKKTGLRPQLVIATKGGHPMLKTPLVSRLAPEQIVSDLDESLAALGVEQIDLYFLHRDDPARPVADILETLNAQVRAGKIRYFACSNWQPERIRAAHAYAAAYNVSSFAASQIFWSLAVANPGAFPSDNALMDDNALAFYSEANMAVMAFTSQARGFFSKIAADGLEVLKPEHLRQFKNDENLARLARAQQLAQQLDVSVTAITLAYIVSHPFVGVPIIGPRSLAQLQDSLTAADLTLTPEQVEYLTTGA